MASLRKKKLPKPSPATNQPKLGVHTTEASPIALGLAQGFLVFYLLAASCYNFRSQLEVPKCQFTNTFAMPARPALSALSSTSSRKSRVRSAPARKPPSSFRSLLHRTALPLVPRPSPPHRPVEAAVAAAAVAAATERGTAISALRAFAVPSPSFGVFCGSSRIVHGTKSSLAGRRVGNSFRISAVPLKVE